MTEKKHKPEAKHAVTHKHKAEHTKHEPAPEAEEPKVEAPAPPPPVEQAPTLAPVEPAAPPVTLPVATVALPPAVVAGPCANAPTWTLQYGDRADQSEVSCADHLGAVAATCLAKSRQANPAGNVMIRSFVEAGKKCPL